MNAAVVSSTAFGTSQGGVLSRLHRWTSRIVAVAIVAATVPVASVESAGATPSHQQPGGKPGVHKWKPTPAPKPAPTTWKTPAGRTPAVAKPDPKAKRVKELTDKRTANSTVWQMSDGSAQQEVSAGPVHYKDAKGVWQDIDSTVRPVKHAGGFTLGAEADTFHTYFSSDAGSLVCLEQGGQSIQIGADGATTGTPKTAGSAVTYPGAWSGADLGYRVGPDGLKESIVLAKAPGSAASYSFTVTLNAGLTPKQNPDGSIGLFGSESADPLWTIPAPYMADSADDKNSPYGKVYSTKVQQSMTFDAATGTLHLTETPDAGWLADAHRQYPVTIDPTILIAPTSGTAANVMISADGPTSNYATSWRLSVGTTATGAARALIKFPMPTLPAGTTISSADLGLYYDQTFTTGANNVPMQALQANTAWSPTSATWNTAATITGPVAGTSQMTANQLAVWDHFPVTSAVQNWISGAAANNGFVIRATSETLGQGGPRFEGSLYAYGGEVVNYPKLTITYGVPGVALNKPTVIHATGAELSWPAYTNTTGDSANDLAEYQVHRAVYQSFTPSASTEISPVATTQTSFVDSTAVPTPANNSDPYGNAYYYMVVAKTKGGQLIAGPTQLVRLPEAGRTTMLLPSVAATTLSSTQPTTVLNTLANGSPSNQQPWLEVGDNSGTYGVTHSVLDFGNLSQVPAGSQILDAHLKLWQETTTTNTSGAVYELHGLTKSFTGTQATWNTASTGTNWTTAGGDFGTVDGTQNGFTNDPNRRNFDATSIVQGWINTAGTDHGLLVKLASETSTAPQERTIFAGAATAEPDLVPQLVITYLDSSTGATYYAPSTPSDMVPGTTYSTPVTINNTTNATWAAASEVLTYHWTLPDGTDVTGGSQLQTALPSDLASGATVTLNAQVTPPAPTDGNQAEGSTLAWDMYNKTTGVYLSAGAPPAAPLAKTSKTGKALIAGDAVMAGRAVMAAGTSGGIGSLKQQVSVDPTGNNQLGLETFYPYSTTPTGAGTNLYTNEASGNTVWNYDLFSNPSRGFNTFLRLSYNSMSTMDTTTGFGWTVQASVPMRLGQGLQFHPAGNPTSVVMVDGTGNAHQWNWNATSGTWTSPPGVHLFLQRLQTCGPQDTFAQAWKMTKPDRTTFFFDCEGFPTSELDANGNEADFTYSMRQSQNKPEEFLSYIQDPLKRNTLNLTYYNKGDATYSYVDSTGALQTGTNLTDPAIIDHVKSISDVSGRTVNFIYTANGLLAQLVDGAGDPAAKTFAFTYDATQGMKNVKLTAVQDPRGNKSLISYYPTSSPTKWWTQQITDRDSKTVGFAYVQPSPTGATTQTTVTDANNGTEVIQTDSAGRETQTVDPKQYKTTLAWDADNNVSTLTEDNGAQTQWTYDQNTGYLLTEKDAESVKNGYPAAVYTYQTTDALDSSLNGHIADLTDTTTPLGWRWHYTYDNNGNQTSATAPLGNVTNPTGAYKSTYSYDPYGELLSATDANGHTTNYGYQQYVPGPGLTVPEPTGQPATISDAYNNTTAYIYGARGETKQVTDPLSHISTAGYDVFDRPLDSQEPKDQANSSYVVHPAPVYDANDNVTQSTPPYVSGYPVANSSTTTVYDNDDRPLTVTLAANNSTAPRKITYGYDNVGNQTSATKPLGDPTAGTYTTITHYDADNQPDYTLDAAKNKTVMGYDDVGNKTSVTAPSAASPNGAKTQFSFDQDHRLTGSTDASNQTTATGYDQDGRKVSSTDQNSYTTNYQIDPNSQVIEVDVPRTVVSGTKNVTGYDVTKYNFDQVGNNVGVVSPQGVANNDGSYTTETTYDNDNRQWKVLGAYSNSDANYAKNLRPETDYTYDPAGRVSQIDRITQPNKYTPVPDGQTAAAAEHALTTFGYYDNGWTKTSADPFKITTTYDYNGLGEQNLRAVSSADGNLPGGNTASGAATRQMNWLYYPDGSLKNATDTGVPAGWQDQVLTASSPQTGPPNPNWTPSGPGAGYDGSQYYTGQNNSSPFTWELTIPQDGNYQIYVYYPSGGTSASYQATYNGGASTTPAVGQPGYIHIDQSQNAGTWVPLFNTPLAFKAGTNGQQLQLFPGSGAPAIADAIRVVRDDSGDPQPGVRNLDYQYDADGNVSDVSDTSPGATQVNDYSPTFDNLDRLRTMQEKLSGAVVHSLTWDYDVSGNLKSQTQDAVSGSYGYDILNQLTSVTQKQSSTDPGRTTGYTYTPTGQRFTETKGNNDSVTDTYYPDGTLLSLVETNGSGAQVSNHELSYDANNNLAADTATLAKSGGGTPFTRTSTYKYSPNNQVVSVTNDDNKDNQTYLYDSSGNVIEQSIEQTSGAMGTLGFVYDRGRMYKTQYASADGGVYQYDTIGRLRNVSNGNFSGWVNGVGQSYTYDGFDNVTSQSTTKSSGGTTTTDTTNYTYDSLDRPISEQIDPGAAGSQSETIDYLGSSKTIADENISTPSVGIQKTYDYSPNGERLAMVDTASTLAGSQSQTSYYTYNPHSDVEALTDPNGATTATYGYTAYGNPESDLETGSDAGADTTAAFPYNSYRFNAAKISTASGNYDMGFRTYDPNINRFISRDSFDGSGAEQGMVADPYNGNRYGFAGGNPISNIEQNGHDWKSWVGGFAAGAAAYAACNALTDFESAGAGLLFCAGVVGGAAGGAGAQAVACSEGGSCSPGAFAASSGMGAVVGVISVGASIAFGGLLPAGLNAVAAGVMKGAFGGAVGGASGYGIDCGLGGDCSWSGLAKTTALSAGIGGVFGAADGMGTSCGGESFSADTPVQLADGSTKPISDLRPGDDVKSTDTTTGTTKDSKTSAVLVNHDTDLFDLTVHTAQGDQVVHTTAHHLFFDKTKKKWVEAAKLSKGDELTTDDGSVATVVGGVTPGRADGDMWDLTVPGDHDFYVIVGATPVLVHNCPSGVDASGNPCKCAAGPNAYSAAFEMQLDPADFGHGRGYHFTRANEALDAALQSDSAWAQDMENMIPGIKAAVSSVGGRKTPKDWTWQHEPSVNAGGRLGVMRLVPRFQHKPGSVWQSIIHPGGAGGYAEWAIPNGAPKN
jgi:RHS repeat-associated protein